MDLFKAFRSTLTRKKNKHVLNRKIILGICAMDRKAQSKPMKEILSRLPQDIFEVIIFGDVVILDQPIEKWPICDALISFYSSKFPTDKAIAYIKLRKPYIFNDLEMQAVMKDRTQVYELLKSQGVNVPNHVFVHRSDPTTVNTIEEFDEYVIINGVQLNKPLVEKPFDAEDHNIYIYYPMSAGGGSKRLFRKIKDRSSEFYPMENELRREGSYIYEEFLHTQGTDVKVYTVGPEYAHAEARKSPVVDGKVNRDNSGFEVRYPVILSHEEKELSRKIVLAFHQTVCGFDILRVRGKSYVCDVNGFSFVKNSRKYYDDASQILVEIMLTALRPEYHATLSTRAPIIREVMTNTTTRMATALANTTIFDLDTSQHNVNTNNTSAFDHDDGKSDTSLSSTTSRKSKLAIPIEQEELLCVIAVIRHGDRTPKQKIKIKVSEKQYLDYFHSYAKNANKDLKVKSKTALVNFLQITRNIIGSMEIHNSPSKAVLDLHRKLNQVKDVLERWEISGINRKLQMKPQKWVDIHDETTNETKTVASELLLILKWGGDITPLGRVQAEQLGEQFRQEIYPTTEGGGVLRLHSTYRHDLKIQASDEGRVMKTAAAFTKGLLELEGQLTPILASLVTVEEKNRQMLDRGGNNLVKDDMEKCKDHLNILQSENIMTPKIVQQIIPDGPIATTRAMLALKSPLRTLKRIYELIHEICEQLEKILQIYQSPILRDTVANELSQNLDRKFLSSSPGLPAEMYTYGISSAYSQLNSESSKESSSTLVKSRSIRAESEAVVSDIPTLSKYTPPLSPIRSQPNQQTISTTGDSHSQVDSELKSIDDGLYLSETFALMHDRWMKLYKDFYNAGTNRFDLTKVPDVYDMIRYDLLHNSHLELHGMEELFQLSQLFENSVVPNEYGTNRHEKRIIGSKMCGALLERIKDVLAATTRQKDESSHSHNLHDDHGMSYVLDHSHARDLDIESLGRRVRTRLYFTSESHLHTLLNVFRYPADGEKCIISHQGLSKLNEISELSYLTQVVIRLFQDREDSTKFRCELCMSPGATCSGLGNGGVDLESRKREIAPYILLNKSIPYEELIACLSSAIEAGQIQETVPADANATSPAIITNPTVDSLVDKPAEDILVSKSIMMVRESNTSSPPPTTSKESSIPSPLRRCESATVVFNPASESSDTWETLATVNN